MVKERRYLNDNGEMVVHMPVEKEVEKIEEVPLLKEESPAPKKKAKKKVSKKKAPKKVEDSEAL